MTEAREIMASPRANISLGGLASLAFGFFCYAFFLATFLYMIAFVAGVFVPKTIDHGGIDTPAVMAIAIDVTLLLIFAFQHSIMARPKFKRALTKVVPQPVERSLFVLAATACVVFMIWEWRPITDSVWSISAPVARIALYAIQALGWGTVLLSTFLINHFELFGLNQVIDGLTGRRPAAPTFRTPALYRVVRHPLYLGFVIAFFATPDMSLGHLIFAIGGTAYILVGIFFEERDLIAQFGKKYLDYKKRVPMLLPFRGNQPD